VTVAMIAHAVMLLTGAKVGRVEIVTSVVVASAAPASADVMQPALSVNG
jgi:hypothetical protein